MEGRGNQYALLTMWMVFPNQAAGLQGLLCVDRGALAVKDLGIGSGWQQSRQNWMPAAVVGQRIRMESSGLYNVEAASLHSFSCLGNSWSSRDLPRQPVPPSKRPCASNNILLGIVMFSCFENIHWQVELFIG